ncbi:MAG: PAS domain S-box protein [Nitrospira sp.]|nr:MAG: PAS domain S-box protein [Nitrospira sp.]
MAGFASVYEGHTVSAQRKPAKTSVSSSKASARPARSTAPRRRTAPLPLPLTRLSAVASPEREAQWKFEAMRDCYAALFEYSQAGFLRLDTLGTIVEANLTVARMLGINRKMLIGQPLARFIKPDDQDTFQQHRRNVLKKDIRHSCEVTLLTETGAKRQVFIESLAVQDKPGRIAHWYAMLLDITERKQIADALKNTKEQLQKVLVASNAWLWDWDTCANEMHVSREWMVQFGYEEEELTNDFERWDSLLHPDDRDRVLAYLRAYLEKPVGNYRQEFRVRHRDGSYRWIASTAVPSRESDGQQIRMLGFDSDITDRKQLEAQFYQAQKMEAVGRFSASVAHDFNNLLTVINGYSALLIDQLPPDDSRHKMVAETLRAGERAATLTKQLLAFSRRQVLKLEPINLNDSIRSIRSMLGRLLGKGFSIALHLAPDLWPIGADKGQFDQIIMNLAVNSRDAMPDGGELTFGTHNVEWTNGAPDPHGIMPTGHYVELSIGDTGQGMSPETMAHIFEPFFTTKEIGKGTGLGLSTVYGIVKQSHGYIFVDSKLNRGTTFQLYFPRVAAAQVLVDIAPTRPAGCSETLLVVEDQDSIRALMVRALMQQGYRVIEAANGEDALQAAASLTEPVQVLVTDIIMPRMTGLALAEQLRQVWPGLRVFYMSGYSGIELPDLLDKPENACIQKPFLPKALVEQLRVFLDNPTHKQAEGFGLD